MKFYQQILLPSLKKSLTTSMWLLKIILPISLVVRFLDYFGVLTVIGSILDPVFVFLGLPGSTGIVFITSIFLPLYAPIAILTSMSVTLRELTILALMCQITHNIPVESSIQARTGTPFWRTATVRIIMSIVVGFVLNLILPKEMGMPIFAVTDPAEITTISNVLIAWLTTSLTIAALILMIIAALNVLYAVLVSFNMVDKLSQTIAPLLRMFGLPKSTGFLWLIGYIVGLAYGGALMVEQLKDGTVNKNDATLLNYHLAMSHSVIEDSLLFVVLGVSFWWIVGVRLVAAWTVVWCARLFNHLGNSEKCQ